MRETDGSDDDDDADDADEADGSDDALKWRVAGGGSEWVGLGWTRESRGGKLSVNAR